MSCSSTLGDKRLLLPDNQINQGALGNKKIIVLGSKSYVDKSGKIRYPLTSVFGINYPNSFWRCSVNLNLQPEGVIFLSSIYMLSEVYWLMTEEMNTKTRAW